MLIANIKITLRNLSRSNLFSDMNLFCLAIAIPCGVLLAYVLNGLPFDKHQHKANDTYIIRSENYLSGSKKETVAITAPYALMLLQMAEGKDCEYEDVKGYNQKIRN
jgi:hypothetical protein